jgi:hypothetical protein
MSMQYVPRKYLYSAQEVEEDGFLLTENGEIPVQKGNVVLHNEFDNPIVETKDNLSNTYAKVNKVKKSPRKTEMSPFEIEYMKGLLEFGGLNQNEDQDYIDGQMNLNKIKR